MKKLISSVLLVALWLGVCGSLFPGDHPPVPANYPLGHEAMIIAVGGAPTWACFAMGLVLGAALATLNGFAALGAAVFIALNCT